MVNKDQLADDFGKMGFAKGTDDIVIVNKMSHVAARNTQPVLPKVGRDGHRSHMGGPLKLGFAASAAPAPHGPRGSAGRGCREAKNPSSPAIGWNRTAPTRHTGFNDNEASFMIVDYTKEGASRLDWIKGLDVLERLQWG